MTDLSLNQSLGAVAMKQNLVPQRRWLGRLWRCAAGNLSVELALVLPILVLNALGTYDFGRAFQEKQRLGRRPGRRSVRDSEFGLRRCRRRHPERALRRERCRGRPRRDRSLLLYLPVERGAHLRRPVPDGRRIVAHLRGRRRSANAGPAVHIPRRLGRRAVAWQREDARALKPKEE